MKIPENPRVALAGSVNSSRKTLEKLIEHNLNVVGVYGLHPHNSKNVSGYNDLRNIAIDHGLPFNYFSKINDPEVIKDIKDRQPDILFVVGLSQMVKKELLSIPSIGCIGFHPTKLPEGRGRGAVAWIALGKAPGAATFFMMDEGMDSGPIFAQNSFDVDEEDYAQDIIDKIVNSIDKALDNVLPELKKGKLLTQQQNHAKATILGKRNPEDGLIDWNKPADEIIKLIRATSSPLPGAYTYFSGRKMIVNRAIVEQEIKYIGVPGRILLNTNSGVLVQSGNGLIWIQEFEGVEKSDLLVGKSLGLNFELEVLKLKSEIEILKNQLYSNV